jgi:hypothetical protein
MSGLLADRRDEFQPGEQAILQCYMNPPHPDMWVELTLYDSEHHRLRRYGQIVPREDLRANFTHVFDESLTPGPYDFVLAYNDQEIARRRIHVAFDPAPSAATSEVTAAR